MKRKSVKILLILFIVVILFMISDHNLLAAINESYGSASYISGNTDVDKKIAGSSVLDIIAKFVYAIASWIETIIAKLFEMLTGQNMFPWADKIIFNTIPFLDVNFLNPSNNSLFKSGSLDTSLQKIVKNTYYTILIVAISFLSISVAVMAIKIATSSLAGEKAKYKQAVTNWLFAIVMLFAMHYVIAFIFYVNEEMVKVASKILASNIKDVTIEEKSNTYLSKEGEGYLELINSNITANHSPTSGTFVYRLNPEDSNAPTPYPSLTYAVYEQMKAELINDDVMISVIGRFAEECANKDADAIDYYENSLGVQGTYMAVTNGEAINEKDEPNYTMLNIRKDTLSELNGIDQEGFGYPRMDFYYRFAFLFLYSDIKGLKYLSKGIAPHSLQDNYGLGGDKDYGFSTIFGDDLEDRIAAGEEISDSELTNIEQKYLYKLYKEFYLSTTENTNTSIVTELAEYFKSYEYQITNTATYQDTFLEIKGENSVTEKILYAILIIQSILYLFSYIKRFFYILVLAMMAPGVVVFEFFNKSII